MSGSGDERGARAVAGRLARSRWLRAAVVLLAAAGLLAWWLAPSGAQSYERGTTIPFSTGVKTGVYWRYGNDLKPDIEHDLPGVRVKLSPSAGSVQNIERVVSGKAMLTIAAADAVADYSGPGRDRLVACARLYDDYVHLVVPAGSEVRTAAGLKGLRVGVGQPGSGVNLLATRLLRAAGLDPKVDVEAVPIGIDEAPRRLRHGEIDAFFWSGGLPTVAITDLAKTFATRLVPLGELVEPLREQEGDLDVTRSYYRQAMMPTDAYPAAYPHGESVATIAVANLLVTTDRADPELVEQITRTVLDSRDDIGRRVHAAQLVDLRTAIYTDPLPLHEGARRYYRSVKP